MNRSDSMREKEKDKEPEKKKFDSRLVPTFLQKTYALVDVGTSNQNKDHKGIVSWGEEPNTFVIYDPNRFAREVLPLYFKQNKMASFVRQVRNYPNSQLNMYDFHKKAIQDRKARVYYHPLFQKDNEALLAKIKRKKNSKRSGRNSLSPENKSVSGKQRRTRFLEDVYKLILLLVPNDQEICRSFGAEDQRTCT